MGGAPQLRDSQEQVPGPQRPPRCRHVLSDETWKLHREEIYKVYVEEKYTLSQTMRIMEDLHGFKASKRKYKMKLKEWNFDKYLRAADMKIIVAKESKRAAEGKETVFYIAGQEMNAEKIENFKKRIKLDGIEMPSPSAETPPNITYDTPRANHKSVLSEETDNETFCTENSPRSNESISDSSPGDLLQTPAIGEMNYFDDDLSKFIEYSTERDTIFGGLFSINGEVAHAPSARHGENLAEVAGPSIEIRKPLAPLFTPLEASNLNGSLDLAYIHRMTNHSNDGEYAYRQLIAGCKKLCGVSFLFTLQAISALAVLRDERKGYFGALPICVQEIEGFEELGTIVNRREYQHYLREFISLLPRTGHGKDLVVLFSTKTAESNKLGLKQQEIRAIRSLLESHLELNCLGDLKSLMSEMKKVLDENLEIDSDHLPESISEGVHLVNARSMLGEFVRAHSIFSSVLPKLQLLSNTKYGLPKIDEYQVFGLHSRSQEIEVDAAKYLLLAYEGLVNLGRKKDAVTTSVKNTLIEILLAEFQELYLQGGIDRGNILHFTEKRLENILFEGSGQTESSMESENSDDEEDDAKSSGKNNDDDDTKTYTTSCKYGLTYSVSEITGVSDSDFMVP